MNIQQITQAIRKIVEQGHSRISVSLRDGTSVEVSLGEDNAPLTFQDEDGAVTFNDVLP